MFLSYKIHFTGSKTYRKVSKELWKITLYQLASYCGKLRMKEQMMNIHLADCIAIMELSYYKRMVGEFHIKANSLTYLEPIDQMMKFILNETKR